MHPEDRLSSSGSVRLLVQVYPSPLLRENMFNVELAKFTTKRATAEEIKTCRQTVKQIAPTVNLTAASKMSRELWCTDI